MKNFVKGLCVILIVCCFFATLPAMAANTTDSKKKTNHTMNFIQTVANTPDTTENKDDTLSKEEKKAIYTTLAVMAIGIVVMAFTHSGDEVNHDPDRRHE